MNLGTKLLIGFLIALGLSGAALVIYLATRKLQVKIKRVGSLVYYDIIKGFSVSHNVIDTAVEGNIKEFKFGIYDCKVNTNAGDMGINIYAGTVPVLGVWAFKDGGVKVYEGSAIP